MQNKKNKKKVDLNKIVEFYDPHPGVGDSVYYLPASVPPPPEAVKKVADELSGQKLSLSEALKRFRAAAGTIELVSENKCIFLQIKTAYGRTHIFRMISYK